MLGFPLKGAFGTTTRQMCLLIKMMRMWSRIGKDPDATACNFPEASSFISTEQVLTSARSIGPFSIISQRQCAGFQK